MEQEYVGVDLHRRTSTVYRMSADGEMLGCVRIPSEPMALATALSESGPQPEVVLESTCGWYWAADLLEDLGARVHLAHPLGNHWGNRRVRTTSATPRTSPPCCAWAVWPRAGSPRRRCGSGGSWSATGTAW